jgi:hypothetical protein
MRKLVVSGSALVALSLGIACSGSSQNGPASATAAKPSAPSAAVVKSPNNVPIATFTATLDHAHKTLVFNRAPSVIGVDPHSGLPARITPQSINGPVSDPGSQGGNPATNTVDLDTLSCTDGYPTTPTFSCDVELISGFSRSLANVYVQVNKILLPDGGNGGSSAASQYDYASTDSPLELDSTNDGSLTQEDGLWSYGNSAYGADGNAPAYPVIGPKGGGFNSATVTWDFNNPGDLNVVYTIVVYATEFWADYSAFQSSNGDNTYGNMAYNDACTGGTSSTAASVALSLPADFDFTLYNKNTATPTTLTICNEVGGISMSGSCEGNAATVVQLPKASVGNPQFFAFWDQLKFGTAVDDQTGYDAAGQVCYKTLGTAPNRREVIEWRNMQFRAGTDAKSSLDFEMYLYEGTDEIDLYYYSMNPPTTDTTCAAAGTCRATCDNATTQCFVGCQGKDAAGYNPTTLKSVGASALTGEGTLGIGGLDDGTAYKFLPLP